MSDVTTIAFLGYNHGIGRIVDEVTAGMEEVAKRQPIRVAGPVTRLTEFRTFRQGNSVVISMERIVEGERVTERGELTYWGPMSAELATRIKDWSTKTGSGYFPAPEKPLKQIEAYHA